MDLVAQTVLFNGISPSNAGIISKNISETFESDIITGSAALQSFNLGYSSYHQLFQSAVQIQNIHTNGNRIECEVQLQLTNDAGAHIDANASKAVILFIVERE